MTINDNLKQINKRIKILEGEIWTLKDKLIEKTSRLVKNDTLTERLLNHL